MPKPERLVNGTWQVMPDAMIETINEHKALCTGCNHSYSWQSCTILTRLLTELETETP